MTGMGWIRIVPVACGVFAVASATAWGAAPGRPTYTKDIAPIFNANCVSCHRPGETAPMSLTSFEEVRPWAKAILKNVGERVMPPWHADKGIRDFANDRSLNEEQVATIVKWVEQGAKQGDPKDMPALPEFPDAQWRLGEPDLVIKFNKVDLPANGPDQFYNLTQQLHLSEDKWVRAVEVRPSNRKVTHHVIVYQTEGKKPPQGWLAAWAAGMDPMAFPEKMGRLVKKDATIIGDMHYHPTDAAATDETSVGLFFADPSTIQKEVINLWVANQNFEIPAGNPSFKARSTFTFPQDSEILAVLPHMHYRGKSFTYTAKYPDGHSETLMSTSNYDFNWQTNYTFKEPVFVPKGTRIDCIAEWDNSANNPKNPDPTKSVRFGPESTNEMMIGFVDYVVKDGVRPVPPEEIIAQHVKDFAAQHPSDVYDALLSDPDDDEEFGHSALYLPREGASSWYIAFMGNVYQVTMSDVVWTGNSVTATASVSGFGTFKFEATKDPVTSELKGKLIIPGENMLVTGKPQH
jgi:mono/diheme cytochrome c family protein